MAQAPLERAQRRFFSVVISTSRTTRCRMARLGIQPFFGFNVVFSSSPCICIQLLILSIDFFPLMRAAPIKIKRNCHS